MDIVVKLIPSSQLGIRVQVSELPGTLCLVQEIHLGIRV